MKNTALTDFRKSRNLTAKEAARLLRCNRATLYRWEQSLEKMPVRKLDHVANVTGIPKHELRPDIFGAQQ